MGRARITNISNLQCLVNVESLAMGENALTTVDISNLSNLATIYFFGNNLTSINFQNSLAIYQFYLRENAFPESEVNRILIAVDDADVLNGYLDLSFGTSASPSGAGVTAKNNLVSKGWTVQTN